MECTQKSNKCSCTYPCERHGKCCDCLEYHRRRNELPGCLFSAEDERTYDRSIAFFVKCNSR
jgi:hypothetical protein